MPFASYSSSASKPAAVSGSTRFTSGGSNSGGSNSVGSASTPQSFNDGYDSAILAAAQENNNSAATAANNANAMNEYFLAMFTIAGRRQAQKMRRSCHIPQRYQNINNAHEKNTYNIYCLMHADVLRLL